MAVIVPSNGVFRPTAKASLDSIELGDDVLLTKEYFLTLNKRIEMLEEALTEYGLLVAPIEEEECTNTKQE